MRVVKSSGPGQNLASKSGILARRAAGSSMGSPGRSSVSGAASARAGGLATGMAAAKAKADNARAPGSTTGGLMGKLSSTLNAQIDSAKNKAQAAQGSGPRAKNGKPLTHGKAYTA
jgi:hypothetical protein